MPRRFTFRRFAWYAFLVATLAAAGITLYLDMRVRGEFEGRRFALPARIYARPLELHQGLRISQADVEDELRQLGYREAPPEGDSGWFSKNSNTLEIALRPFIFWDGRQPAKRVNGDAVEPGCNLFALARFDLTEEPFSHGLPL